MVDISKIEGPSGLPDPTSGKKAKDPTNEFKKLMKIEKVDETDSEQRKKRKRREEEEEEPLSDVNAPSTPPGHVPPFLLDEQGKKVEETSEFNLPSSLQAPTESERPPQGDEDLEAFLETFPAAPSSEASEQQPSASLPSSPSETGQLPSQTQPPSTTTPAKTAQPARETPLAEAPSETKEEQKETFFKEFGKHKEEALTSPLSISDEEKRAEEAANLEGIPVATPKELVSGQIDLKAKEKKVEETSLSMEPDLTTAPLPSQIPEATAPTTPAYAYLSPQVLDLFERMVGVMTVMTSSGIAETSFILNAPQFASSIFFGSQIIITEFSTAPKVFNIRLSGSPQALQLFQGNADDLMAAFQGGNYAFKVNRLETTVLEPERPLFRRKEGQADTGKEQDQGT